MMTISDCDHVVGGWDIVKGVIKMDKTNKVTIFWLKYKHLIRKVPFKIPHVCMANNSHCLYCYHGRCIKPKLEGRPKLCKVPSGWVCCSYVDSYFSWSQDEGWATKRGESADAFDK